MADVHRFPAHTGTSRIVATRLDDGRLLVEFPDCSRTIIESRMDLIPAIVRWLADQEASEREEV